MNVLTSPTRRLVAVLTAALMMVTAACSVRLDTPPAAIPEPEAAEAFRQASAVATAELATLARSALAEDDGVVTVLEDVAADAEVQLEALAGVWEPPPRPEDSGAEPPGDAATADASDGEAPTAADVLDALVVSSQEAREAVASPEVSADLATLLSVIVLNRDAAASRLADRIGASDPVPAPEPRTPATLDAGAAGLCRTLDALGYTGELIAARRSGDARERTAATAARDRDLAEQVAIAAGFDDSDSDPREATYTLAMDEEAELEAQIEDWRGDLAIGWLAQIASAEVADRAGILDHARAAARVAPGVTEAPLPGWQG